jgi:hypothetical protein
VLSKVQQNVDDCVSNLARRCQRSCVVAVTPHSVDAGDTLDRQGDADDEASDASGHVVVAVGLDDRVHVILLHGEMQNPKRCTVDTCDRVSNGCEKSKRT